MAAGANAATAMRQITVIEANGDNKDDNSDNNGDTEVVFSKSTYVLVSVQASLNFLKDSERDPAILLHKAEAESLILPTKFEESFSDGLGVLDASSVL